MIARLQHVIEVLDERLFDTEDARAKAHGWNVRRAGRFDLTRVYRDSRWQGRCSTPELSDGSLTVEGAANDLCGEEMDAVGQRGVSLPDHSNREGLLHVRR
ncbi:hypothetical protein [Amycolatopsis sp. lyj-23]|uniref:hypothetical protein n=1 Tax=Amycolatopsis sp. lyj-23 TaxID=2789283 RepID=UPI00397C7060